MTNGTVRRHWTLRDRQKVVEEARRLGLKTDDGQTMDSAETLKLAQVLYETMDRMCVREAWWKRRSILSVLRLMYVASRPPG